MKCKADCEECGNDCYTACPTNEVRNAQSCQCECPPPNGIHEGVCGIIYTLTVVVNHKNARTGGRVTGNGFNCTGTCSRKFMTPRSFSFSGSANSGYECKFVDDASFMLTGDTTVTANCDSTLSVNPGGPYTATYFDLGQIGGGRFYSVTVTASASGGVPGYMYTWQGLPQRVPAIGYYVFSTRGNYEKSVTVEDSHGVTERGDATIYAGTGQSRSDSGAPASFEVPLGGDLYIAWGEDSSVTAGSADTAIVTVSVSSPTIRVTGVAAGETDVVVQTEGGELRLPVVVK